MLKNIMNDESGQGMVEYGLILALVSIVAVGALTVIGTNVNGKFESIGTTLGAPVPPEGV